MSLRILAVAAALVLLAPAAGAQDRLLAPFIGTYVGTAQVFDETGAVEEERDMDVTIAANQRDGFVITWINVTKVNGRRDVPGVARRVEQVEFFPGDQAGIYVEETRGSLFEARRQMDPMAGDPIRWASIADGRLGVFSIVLMEDGRYELQSYERILTENGIDIVYERIVEDEVVRRITGTTIRVE